MLINNKCVVAVPIYRESLLFHELLNLRASLPNLEGFDIIFVKPESLNIRFMDSLGFEYNTISFPDQFFKSVISYSRLMLSVNFYEKFSEYTHVLILQLDAVILKPELKYWVEQPYDYIGAPWARPIKVPFKTKNERTFCLGS